MASEPMYCNGDTCPDCQSGLLQYDKGHDHDRDDSSQSSCCLCPECGAEFDVDVDHQVITELTDRERLQRCDVIRRCKTRLVRRIGRANVAKKCDPDIVDTLTGMMVYGASRERNSGLRVLAELLNELEPGSAGRGVLHQLRQRIIARSILETVNA